MYTAHDASTPHKRPTQTQKPPIQSHQLRPFRTTLGPMTDTDEGNSGEYAYTGAPHRLADLKVRIGRWIEERRLDD